MIGEDLRLPANSSIGFIGAGRMAQALVSGIVSAENLAIERVCFVDPADPVAEKFSQLHPASQRLERIADVVAQSRMVLLAVKPQSMDSVLQELAESVRPEHLVVSVAAGVPIRRFESALGVTRIIRVMPNTPCLIGEGMSAMACHPSVAESDRRLVQTILQSMGLVVEVDETDLDAVTGLSGSGPAYVFTFIEALIDGAVAMGLSGEVARQLTLQTIHGANRLIETTGASPDELRRQVTSPGGTTLAGLEALQQHGFSAAVQHAVEAATNRSIELSQ